MELQEFYAEKRKNHIRLVKDLLAGKHDGQPAPEDWLNPETDELEKRPVYVYLTSVRKREAGTIAGHVCLVEMFDKFGKPGLASERITDGTHRVSTPEEINNYLMRQVEQKKFHDKADIRMTLQRTQVISPDAVNTMPEHLRELANAKPGGKK